MPLEVYNLLMASSMDFKYAYARIMNCSDFIRKIAARDGYCGLCYTEFNQGPGHENATQELEAISLAMCQNAESFSQTLPQTTTLYCRKRSE